MNRPHRRQARQRAALLRRKEEIARWEAGEFPDYWIQSHNLLAIVRRKTETAREEIATLEKRVGFTKNTSAG